MEVINDYPKQVSIETATICNADCDFCPQSKLARRGHIMEMGIIEKIVRELAEFPLDINLEIAPNGVNEPLADKRICDILDLISDRLPRVKIYFVTNGNLISEETVTKLSRHNISRLCISLNFCDKETYERRMGLRWEKTVRALDMMHEKVKVGELPHPVKISRVEDGTEYDARFVSWVEAKYPAFSSLLKSSGNWLGAVPDVSHRVRGAKGKCSHGICCT